MISDDIDAGEFELNRERFGETPGIAARDARAAARADLDLDDAEGFQRAQRVARDDARDAALIGDVLLAAEEIARLQPLLEQRLAYFGDKLRRQGRATEAMFALGVAEERMNRHSNSISKTTKI